MASSVGAAAEYVGGRPRWLWQAFRFAHALTAWLYCRYGNPPSISNGLVKIDVVQPADVSPMASPHCGGQHLAAI